MSTSSKPKSRAPAHQNAFAFRHNKNSKLTRQIAHVETEGLCRRCADKIEWRKRYRKYKPLSAPRKCNICAEKKIRAAYRTICADCADAAVTCEGCAHVPMDRGEGSDVNGKNANGKEGTKGRIVDENATAEQIDDEQGSSA